VANAVESEEEQIAALRVAVRSIRMCLTLYPSFTYALETYIYLQESVWDCVSECECECVCVCVCGDE
jgi:hypothetical protein